MLLPSMNQMVTVAATACCHAAEIRHELSIRPALWLPSLQSVRDTGGSFGDVFGCLETKIFFSFFAFVVTPAKGGFSRLTGKRSSSSAVDAALSAANVSSSEVEGRVDLLW